MGRLNPKFRMICQRRENWCWAAVSTAVRAYPPPTPTRSQCAVATSVLGGTFRCCPGPDSCNFPFSLREALEKVDKLLLFVESQVEFDVIQDEIDVRKRPVCARIEIDDDGEGSAARAHFVVIVGCRKRGRARHVSVMDPYGGDDGFSGTVESNVYHMTFKQFQRRYRKIGTWGQTYLVK